VIWFDRGRARDLTATLELRVRLRRGRKPVAFALRIREGRLRIRPGAPADASASATVHAGDLVRLAIGTTGWPALLSSGRLELSGDPFLALRFPTLFRLPAGGVRVTQWRRASRR
jgi:hypothetical protein